MMLTCWTLKIRIVKLIIGSNVPEAFWVMEERRGNKGEPYAIRSPFGWTLFGPTNSTNNQPLHHMVNVIQEKEQQENSDTLLQQLQQFWKIEHGIASPDVKASMSVEDKHALSIMNKSVKLVDNHYQIGLPWKQEIPYLPNNRCLAEQRLKSLKKRFLRDEELFDKYKSTVLDYIGKGHARRVPEQEVNVQDKPLWYLPHHPVFNPNKPNKTRVVFDCAARFKETSLNDQLLSGPDLTNTIVGVLTRFRQERVALVADIECMFHQVKVTPDDYDAFRFLWWRDNDLHKDLVDYRMEVHLFGATSSPSCASYALRRTAEDNKDQYNKDIVSTVDKNFYVDDCLKSVKSTDEAVTLVSQLTEMLLKGGFRLTKWLSNDAEVIRAVPEAERSSSILDLDLDRERLPVERTLGLKWDIHTDSFTFDVKPKERPKTRRGILSVTSSVYDPLGFLAPIVLPAKRIIQDLCRNNVGWDDPIGDEVSTQWEKWKAQLPQLTDLSVKRCLRPETFGEVKVSEIHTFASQFAYGAVSYWWMYTTTCSFLMGKSRLAHIRPMTVPRLELSAAILASEMDRVLKNELEINIDESVLWSDSTSTIQYIRNTSRRFHTFVANRLTVIHNNTSPHQWRYVPTELNPADHASRGLSVKDMSKTNTWLIGPGFLVQDKVLWPAEPISTTLDSCSEDDVEVKAHQCYVVTSTPSQSCEYLSQLINRHSSWIKLKRAVAWILKLKKWIVSKHHKTSVSKGLSVQDLQSAELVIIRHVQKESFQEVIDTIAATQATSLHRQVKRKLKSLKTNPSVHKLNPMC